MWATRGDAAPLAEIYMAAGCVITPSSKGAGSRVSGWQRLREHLADGPACPHHRQAGLSHCPRLHIFSSLPELWRELTQLPHASLGDPEDADTRCDDHAADSIRYAISGLAAGGPEWTLFDTADNHTGTTDPIPGQANMFGIPITQPLGPYGYLPASNDPWAMVEKTSSDETETQIRRIVRTQPDS